MGGSAVAAGVIADAVAAAKAYLRVEDGAEDATIARLAASAIGLAEAYCAQALVARAFEDDLPVMRGWQALPATPVSAIDAVIGVPGGALAVGGYAIDIDRDGVGWVRILLPGAATRVRVTYRAGAAATWDALPGAVAQGIVMLVAHLFARRDDDAAPPAAVAALWRPYRRLRLTAEPAA